MLSVYQYVLSQFGPTLTSFQRSLLELMPTIQANADLLARDPASFNESDRVRFLRLRETVLGNAAIQRMAASGNELKLNGALLRKMFANS